MFPAAAALFVCAWWLIPSACSPRVNGGVPAGVDDDELPVFAMAFGSERGVERVFGVEVRRKRVQRDLAQRWIGHVLAGDGADAGAQVDAARRDGRTRGTDHHAERARFVAGRQRERHAVLPGSAITAVASISTSHSGRARAETTIPVDTGCTPLSQRPITRYTGSR